MSGRGGKTMEKQDFAKLIKGLKESYPNFKIVESKEGFDMWFLMLCDIPYPVLSKAVQKHIATNKYPPSIAEIRELATNSNSGDWSQGWDLVRQSLRKFGYYRSDEAIEWLRSLDPITGEVARRLGYQELCLSENLNVERANFRMAYETTLHRSKLQQQLPPNLQDENQSMNKLVENIGNKFKVSEGISD